MLHLTLQWVQSWSVHTCFNNSSNTIDSLSRIIVNVGCEGWGALLGELIAPQFKIRATWRQAVLLQIREATNQCIYEIPYKASMYLQMCFLFKDFCFSTQEILLDCMLLGPRFRAGPVAMWLPLFVGLSSGSAWCWDRDLEQAQQPCSFHVFAYLLGPRFRVGPATTLRDSRHMQIWLKSELVHAYVHGMCQEPHFTSQDAEES